MFGLLGREFLWGLGLGLLVPAASYVARSIPWTRRRLERWASNQAARRPRLSAWSLEHWILDSLFLVPLVVLNWLIWTDRPLWEGLALGFVLWLLLLPRVWWNQARRSPSRHDVRNS